MSGLLQIHVPKTSYKAGDIISGSVHLISEDGREQDVEDESISIIFIGRLSPTKYWPRVSKSFHLFAYKKNILAGPTTLRNPSVGYEGQYSWPFTFCFPVNCNAVQNEGLPASPLSLFNTDKDQPLPPSFSAFSKDSNSRDAISIVYELQATLLSRSTIGYRPTTCFKRLELDFYVPRSIERPGLECTRKTQRITCQTLDLFPEEHRETAKRPLRLREKLGLKSAPIDHLPKSVFDAKLQILSAAIIGEPLPIFLHIDYDLESSTIPAPPAVYLKKVAVWFREETSMLVPSPFSTVGEQELAGWMKESQLAMQDFDKERLLVNGFLDMRKIINLTMKDDLIPTFKTFNIARSYGIKVDVTLQCAGKTFFIFGNYNPCMLLAKEFDPDVSQYVQPAASAIMKNETDDPPPPYETVEQPAAPSQSSQASQQRRRRINGILPAMSSINAAAAAFSDNATSATAAAAAAEGGGGGGGGDSGGGGGGC